MTSSEFAQLLQNELILPRDPHLVARFEALLAENFSVDPEEVPIVVEPQLKPVEDWTRRRFARSQGCNPEVNASLPADGVKFPRSRVSRTLSEPIPVTDPGWNHYRNRPKVRQNNGARWL
jgi:hypothetical protein